MDKSHGEMQVRDKQEARGPPGNGYTGEEPGLREGANQFLALVVSRRGASRSDLVGGETVPWMSPDEAHGGTGLDVGTITFAEGMLVPVVSLLLAPANLWPPGMAIQGAHRSAVGWWHGPCLCT